MQDFEFRSHLGMAFTSMNRPCRTFLATRGLAEIMANHGSGISAPTRSLEDLSSPAYSTNESYHHHVAVPRSMYSPAAFARGSYL